MAGELPYRAEYAKSGRASCKGCRTTIDQGTLRLAVMVQSAMFDGRTPNWYHYKCFFNKQRPKTVGDIEHYQSLRYEDQKKIQESIASGPSTSAALPSKGKGKKRAAGNPALRDFVIEYSKSSRAMCRGCELKILKDEVRISKKDFESDVGKKYGGQDLWHHLDCFVKLRGDLLFFDKGENLPGFAILSKEDKQLVKQKLPAVDEASLPPSVKKIKGEVKDETELKAESEEEKKYQDQNKIMFKYRDQLKSLNKKDMIKLLEVNDQYVPEGVEKLLDALSDVLTFGALKPCKKCNGGYYVFNQSGYICQGNLTEWTKCQNVEKNPPRKTVKVPSEIKEEYSFLKKYKCKPQERIIKYIPPSSSVKKEENGDDDGPKIKVKRPLYNMEFTILKTEANKEEIKKRILKLGGKVTTKIHANIMAVISTPAEVEKMGSRITQTKDYDIQVIPEKFLDDIEKDDDIKATDLIKTISICDWGSDPEKRIISESSSSHHKSRSGSMMYKSKSGKVKLKIKGGGAVDPDTGLEDIAHVYQNGDIKYNVVLGITDLQTNRNSYYKMQILKADHSDRFWFFRSWGRIGTTIGGNKLEDMSTLKKAIQQFEHYYYDKSGNDWSDRHNFVKVPGKLYPIDVDYNDDEVQKMEVDGATPSKLQPEVQNLIKLIFDINEMKKVLAEFELDTEKMPLGKLSRKQIQSAFGVLSELQTHVNNNKTEGHEIIDACNRFYTLIPHDYGIEQPPLLNTPEVIKQKLEMLDNLMELEIAYNLMKISSDEKDENPVDTHYAHLKTDIEVLDKNSDEFENIKQYVENTHAQTHRQYELEILDVFKVKRSGEEKRFKPFKKLHNRKLLWHGSRTTNFAGILSQGLRIAPPEAPVTGYMFGKGIYFADMVSKSANYCCTNKSSPTGLLLLSEVALGNMYERTQADYIEKLPAGKHSCKGIGMTQPDPKMSKTTPEGVEIPLGKGITDPKVKTSLLYNEYIVYDIAQVNVKYLLKMDFKFKF